MGNGSIGIDGAVCVCDRCQSDVCGSTGTEDIPICSLQYVSLSSLHVSHFRHADIWAPTPTRSPTLTLVTLEPTLTAWPMISSRESSVSSVQTSKGLGNDSPCPGTSGQVLFPQPPVAVCRSEPQTPQAMILTSMS